MSLAQERGKKGKPDVIPAMGHRIYDVLFPQFHSQSWPHERARVLKSLCPAGSVFAGGVAPSEARAQVRE
jgi:hypothetical protein